MQDVLDDFRPISDILAKVRNLKTFSRDIHRYEPVHDAKYWKREGLYVETLQFVRGDRLNRLQALAEELAGHNSLTTTEALTLVGCAVSRGSQTSMGYDLTALGWRKTHMRLPGGRREWRYLRQSRTLSVSDIGLRRDMETLPRTANGKPVLPKTRPQPEPKDADPPGAYRWTIHRWREGKEYRERWLLRAPYGEVGKPGQVVSLGGSQYRLETYDGRAGGFTWRRVG